MNFCNNLSMKVVLEKISEGLENKNVVTSPWSLNILLNMLAAGTRGRTLEQLLEALEAKSSEETNLQSSKMMAGFEDNDGASSKKGKGGGPVLSTVNGVWTDLRFPLKPSYEEVVKNIYKADTRTVDFAHKAEQILKEVNLWVEKGTKGLIKDLLKPSDISSRTMIILANALYFKGAWKNAFKTSMTRDDDFHLLNGETIKVPFMTSKTNENHFYGSFDGYKLLKLPYRCSDHENEEAFKDSYMTGRQNQHHLNNPFMANKTSKHKYYNPYLASKPNQQHGDDHDEDKRRFSMYVFLPDERNGLEKLLKKFNSEPLLLHQQCDKLRNVELDKMWLPKFKFSYEFYPSKTMKKLGINFPFMPLGELTEMVDGLDSDKVYISAILQKACIEVNEEGTEAAAVTVALGYGACSMNMPPPLPPPSFVADHPFLFMIKEEVSGDVFFTGAVVNPVLG